MTKSDTKNTIKSGGTLLPFSYHYFQISYFCDKLMAAHNTSSPFKHMVRYHTHLNSSSPPTNAYEHMCDSGHVFHLSAPRNQNRFVYEVSEFSKGQQGGEEMRGMERKLEGR